MNRFLLYCILLFPMIITAQTSAERGIFIHDDISRQTLWLNENGKVIKTFTEDFSPKLNSGKYRKLYEVLVHQNYAIHHFAIGYLPVKYKDTWQLYDVTGKMVFALDPSYLDVSLASQGNYIATIKDTTGKDAYVYLDTYGKELFQGRVFTETSEFRDNIAFAGKEDTWYKLNGLTNSCVPFENKELEPLHAITRNTALYSQAIAGPKGEIKKYLIDTTGQIRYSTDMCGARGLTNIGSIVDEIIICSQQYKATFFDMKGNLLDELDNVEKLEGIGDGHILFRMRNGEKKLFDYKMDPVYLKIPAGLTYEYDGISKKIIVAKVRDTIADQTYLGFYDGNSKEMLYRMAEYNYGGLIEDRIIYANLKYISNDFIALVSLDGKVLYAQKNKEGVYNIAINGYFPKSEVKGLLVVQDEGIKKMTDYKHVTTVEFQSCQFEELPVCLCEFENLRSITLTDCNNLVRLPSCLGRLPSFYDILIEDCTGLKELETFLLQYPKTLVINTEGHYFSKDFNKVIEEKLPHIKLTSWTDNWFYNNLD